MVGSLYSLICHLGQMCYIDLKLVEHENPTNSWSELMKHLDLSWHFNWWLFTLIELSMILDRKGFEWFYCLPLTIWPSDACDSMFEGLKLSYLCLWRLCLWTRVLQAGVLSNES